MLAEILRRIRSQSPLVHCITNYVTANDCANLLLAAGASPMMADEPLEMEEINALSGAHVFNLGTPNAARIEAMRIAGRAANATGKPVVFDPVGVGSSAFRRQAARQLLAEVRFSIIRGNASEIRTLARGDMAHRGVDADFEERAPRQNAVLLARRTGAVVALTGDQDIVTDGETIFRVRNGHPMMRTVTGAGCMLSALAGACAAANPDKPLQAALAAVCAMGVCGEHAHRRMSDREGNASYRNHIIDALYRLTPEELEEEARYETE